MTATTDQRLSLLEASLCEAAELALRAKNQLERGEIPDVEATLSLLISSALGALPERNIGAQDEQSPVLTPA